MLPTCQIDTTVSEELQPLKDIRRWASKVISPEHTEIESKSEPKHSITKNMQYYQEKEKEETQGGNKSDGKGGAVIEKQWNFSAAICVKNREKSAL